MRKFTLSVLLLGLMAWVSMSALGAPRGEGPGASARGINLAGDVSKDGKTLLAEDDNVWTLSNAGMLQGFEGRHVTVKCRMDPSHYSIRVLYVVEPYKGSPYLRDSAFRR